MHDIQSAVDAGAELLHDGRGKGPQEGYYIGPTIFSAVTNDARLAQEEVFGPVVAIIPYDDEEEVVQIANDTIFGLAAGIWTRDINKAIADKKLILSGIRGLKRSVNDWFSYSLFSNPQELEQGLS